MNQAAARCFPRSEKPPYSITVPFYSTMSDPWNRLEGTVSDLVYIGAPEANSAEFLQRARADFPSLSLFGCDDRGTALHHVQTAPGGMSDVYLEQAYPIVKHNVERFLSGRFDEMINRVPHQPALS